ncbi:MAG: hypothetical protein AAF587_20170 [Bacteroidota bacterium]
MSVTLYHNIPHLAPIFVAAEEGEEEGRILIQVTPAILRQAELNNWFFLQQELKGPMKGGTFVLSLGMQMELTVRPDLIYRFKGLLREWEDAITLLQALSWEASQPGATEPDILLQVDSWLCLGVIQKHPGGMTGFRTLWDDILPQMQARGIGPKDLDFNHMEIHLKKGPDGGEGDAPEVDIQFGEAGQIFAVWPVKDNPRLTPSTPIEDDQPVSSSPRGLLGAFGRMLDGKGIKYSLGEKSSLRFFHAGKNGRWSCEAKVWEDQGTVAVYSLYPLQASEETNASLTSWTNRINSEIAVGTFAFNPESGDLRFRTSANFTTQSGLEAQLSSLWKQNMSTFDSYYQEIHRLMSSE